MELPESGTKRTGAMLASGRAAAGLELVDIARETRVPLRHLKALEADNHADLPALPYAIGFVKSYARALGLDPETVANQFRAETSKSAHVPTLTSLEPLDERRLPSSTLVVISVAVVIAIIAGLSAWGAGAFDPPPPQPADAIAASAPEPISPVADPADDPALVSPTATASAAAGAPMATAGPVVLTAREPVWIKIYDGATKANVKTGTLAAGESYTVPAQPGLQLWTGKAGALDVSIAGRPIPPLGGLVETIRNVSLAPADLVARQAARDGANGPAAAPAAAPSGIKPIATIPVPKPIATPPATAAPVVPAPGN